MVTTKFGVFEEIKYQVPGQPSLNKTKQEVEQKKELPCERTDGLNLKVAGGRRGKGQDATFSRFQRLYEGEPYIDSSRLKQKMDAEKRNAKPIETPFKCTNPMKDQSGNGDYYGTLGGKIAYMEGTPFKQKTKADVKEEPRSIYTNKSKKGGYGINKTTLSELYQSGGRQGEYKYCADPEEYQQIRRKIDKEMWQSKKVSESPFKPANPSRRGGPGVPGRTLGGKGQGVVGEYEYKVSPPQEKQKKEQLDKNAFRYTNLPKCGYNATFSKFPQYYADPDELKAKAKTEARLAASQKLAQVGNAWKPNSKVRSDATKSIIRMNIR